MKTDFKSKVDLIRYYADEAKCIELLAQQRWGATVSCIHCGSCKVYTTNRGYKCADKLCHKKFTVISGTIFENTKIPLNKWFEAIFVITAHKKGISSHQLAKDIGVSQKTAWFINHRVREMLIAKNPALLNNVVEIDETYIGGKERNKIKSKRRKINGTDQKTPVFGLVERQGNMVVQVVNQTTGAFLKPIIRNNVSTDAIVCTDGHGAYKNLDREFKDHGVVQHDRDEHVRGIYHTNTMEGFWSLFKRGIIGVYHYVSPKHLQRYADEFAFRYNSRKATDVERFANVLKYCDGRLKYNDLIQKHN